MKPKNRQMARRATNEGQSPIGYHEAHQMGNFVQMMHKNALEAFARSLMQQALTE